MAGRCCLPAGYVPPEKAATLRLLAEAGLDLPAGAQIWGGTEGWAWRVVDERGQDLPEPVTSRHPLRTLAGLTTLTVVARDGRRVVTPG